MRLTSLVLLLFVSPFTVAQSPAIIDYATPGGRAFTAAQVSCGQLLAEMRLLSISGNALPANLQQQFQQGLTRATEQINILYRGLQVGATLPQLQPQIDVVNRSLTEAATFVQQNAPNDRSLNQVIARVEFAWRRTQLRIAQACGGFRPITPGVPLPPAQLTYIATFARALNRQSDVLVTVGQATLPRTIWGESLDRAIREFSGACERLRDHVDRGVPFDAPLAQVQSLWESLARTLGGVEMNKYPAVRQQAARVNQLYLALLAAVGQPQIPVPIFPINNPKALGTIAIGAGEGGVPVVRVYSDRLGGDFHDFMAYDPKFQGGVRVAVGDVNGDGILDIITAPGPGMAPMIRIFDGRDLSLINQYLAYDQNFLSGVFIAAADVTGNGRAEIVTGAGDPGGPHVRAFDGLTGQVKAEFYAYDRRLQCGVRVALGDIDGDGVPDIVTAPGPGIEPIIKVFNGRGLAELSTFQAYDPAFKGGVFVASADVTRNGRAEVITGAGTNGGPHVRIYDPMQQRLIHEFYAYDQSFLGGVRVAVCDVVGDRRPDILTAPGPGISPIIRVFRNRDGQMDREFSAFDPAFRGGAWVAGN